MAKRKSHLEAKAAGETPMQQVTMHDGTRPTRETEDGQHVPLLEPLPGRAQRPMETIAVVHGDGRRVINKSEYDRDPSAYTLYEGEDVKVAADDDGIDATDGARELAADEGVDLSEVEGTGSGGKITKPDVKAHLDAQEEE